MYYISYRPDMLECLARANEMKAITWIWVLLLLADSAMLTGCGGGSGTAALPPDFALTVSPQSLSAPVGIGGGTVQISIQPQNGFNQPVSVSLQGLPAGTTTAPASPFNVNPGMPQTVTVSAARGVSPSMATISVQGSSGTLSHSGSFSISVATAEFIATSPEMACLRTPVASLEWLLMPVAVR
jgi:hypothetical protein